MPSIGETMQQPITGAFQIVAGWWRHQPGRSAVGGVSTAHTKQRKATIWNARANNLVVDGEVGRDTAKALGIKL